MNYPKAEMKLTSSASEQNVFLTYICTINETNPRKGKLHTDSKNNYNLFEDPAAQDVNEEDHIKIERSKALHELVEAHAEEHIPIVGKYHVNINGTAKPSTSASDSEEVYNKHLKYEVNDNSNKQYKYDENDDTKEHHKYELIDTSNEHSKYEVNSNTNKHHKYEVNDNPNENHKNAVNDSRNGRHKYEVHDNLNERRQDEVNDNSNARNKDEVHNNSNARNKDEVHNNTNERHKDEVDDNLYARHNDEVGNPNILKLTKMKWLTEGRESSPDSRSPTLSPVSSTTDSECSIESETNLRQRISFGDKYLSTILRLDKEHNLFGLSNIAIVGSRTSKKTCKKDEKPVFHQTAIVQVCCGKKCCRHKSNTDLPAVLKCGSCKSCCYKPQFTIRTSCNPACAPPKCEPKCAPCPEICCFCKLRHTYSKCRMDCDNCFGLTLTLKRKPKYEETFVELTPRSSCVQAIPEMARMVNCQHIPQCLPPSPCFPYLMPCYWPARPSAPCTAPTRCFHTPPCLPARKPRSKPMAACPPKCDVDKAKCTEPSCPGNIPELRKQIESKFGASTTK